MNREKIKAKVTELFDGKGEVKDFTGTGFSIEFRYHDTSFDDLMLIHEAFGTRKINFRSESREGGYCETCRYSYTVNIIDVDDVDEQWR